MIGPLFENLWIPFLTPKRYKNQSIAFTSSPSQVEFPIRIIRVRLFQTFSTNRGSIIFWNNRKNRDDYFAVILAKFRHFLAPKNTKCAVFYLQKQVNFGAICVLLLTKPRRKRPQNDGNNRVRLFDYFKK